MKSNPRAYLNVSSTNSPIQTIEVAAETEAVYGWTHALKPIQKFIEQRVIKKMQLFLR